MLLCDGNVPIAPADTLADILQDPSPDASYSSFCRCNCWWWCSCCSHRWRGNKQCLAWWNCDTERAGCSLCYDSSDVVMAWKETSVRGFRCGCRCWLRALIRSWGTGLRLTSTIIRFYLRMLDKKMNGKEPTKLSFSSLTDSHRDKSLHSNRGATKEIWTPLIKYEHKSGIETALNSFLFVIGKLCSFKWLIGPKIWMLNGSCFFRPACRFVGITSREFLIGSSSIQWSIPSSRAPGRQKALVKQVLERNIFPINIISSSFGFKILRLGWSDSHLLRM